MIRKRDWPYLVNQVEAAIVHMYDDSLINGIVSKVCWESVSPNVKYQFERIRNNLIAATGEWVA